MEAEVGAREEAIIIRSFPWVILLFLFKAQSPLPGVVCMIVRSFVALASVAADGQGVWR